MAKKTCKNFGLFKKLKKVSNSSFDRMKQRAEKELERIATGNTNVPPQMAIKQSKKNIVTKEMRKVMRLACSYALNKMGFSGKKKRGIRAKVHQIMQLPTKTDADFRKRSIKLEQILGENYIVFVKHSDFFIENGTDIARKILEKKLIENIWKKIY